MSDNQVSDDRRKTGHRKRSRHSSSSDKHSYHNSKNVDKHEPNVGHHRKRDDRSKHKDHRSHRKSHRRDDRQKRHRSRDRSHGRSRSRDRDSQSSSRRRDKSEEKNCEESEKVIETTTKEEPNKSSQKMSGLELMRQQMKEQLKEQMKNNIGIRVPNYYNPGIVNPIKFAETEKKRKMLWSRDEDNETQEKKSVPVSTSNPWSHLKFGGEKGTEMTEKFRKLMGIKGSNHSTQGSGLNETPKNNERTESAIKSQETLFKNLDLQYSIARISTHTQRGVGLGFGTSRGDK